MADILSGLGGLFSGGAEGLRILQALREAMKRTEIDQGQLDLNKKREQREADVQAAAEARRPYENVQEDVLKPQNVTASLPDIMREYTPPAEADTYAMPGFKAPRFNAAAPAAQPSFGQALTQSPVGDLDTSHIAQVLERAKRRSNFGRSQSVLQDVLTAAGQRAQETQQPVSGAFPDSTGATAQLPTGFSAQPERTFQPYKYGDQSTPQDLLFRQLANDPIKQLLLKKTDPAMYKQFLAWMAQQGYSVSEGFTPVGPPAPPGYTPPSQAPPSGNPVGTSVVPGSQRPATPLTPNDRQRAAWDRAAAAVVAQGGDPSQVLGPRPSAP